MNCGRDLLEKLIAAQPDDPELLSRLAVVFETQGQEERSIRLLEPIRERIGTTEGARILGLADAQRRPSRAGLEVASPVH